MDVEELIARESIRDLVARYNANLDSGRVAPALEVFAPDAVLELGQGEGRVEVRGREAMGDFFGGVKASVAERGAALSAGGGLASGSGSGSGSGARSEPAARPYLRHYTATLQIDLLSASEATSRCYFVVLMAHGVDHWGRYLDRYERRDGRWMIAHRRVLTDGSVPGGFAAGPSPAGPAGQ